MVSVKRADGLAARLRAGKRWAWIVSAGLFLASGYSVRAEAPFALGLPLDCDLNTTCFVQNYVDRDAGPGVKDFRCGAQSYDGHDGVDFRVLSLADGAAVLAAAPGTVKAVRNTMPDRMLERPDDRARAALAGRECGNGVVIAHRDGYETQYCHMKAGSVRVQPGDLVAEGQAIGAVGVSGLTQFPHVHLAVRRNGVALDPFWPDGGANSCLAGEAPAPRTLWQQAIVAKLGYERGRLVDLGLIDRPVSSLEVEQNGMAGFAGQRSSPALVLAARFLHLEKGDVITLSLQGPAGFEAETTSEPMDRAKAQFVAYAGKKRRGDLWPAGTYHGAARVLRDGRAVITRTQDFVLSD